MADEHPDLLPHAQREDHAPTGDEILAMMRGFEAACVVGATAELGIFQRLVGGAQTAHQIAELLPGNLRGITILLDAAAALGVLEKQDDRYGVPAPLRGALREDAPETILPMILHRMGMLRGWSQLAWTARAGIPAPRPASIRGALADREAFVAAMHAVSGPVADELVRQLGPPEFRHLLDVGGASGTWTLAFLRARPDAAATLFDLPDAIELARERVAAAGMAERIALVDGDFYVDELPAGADFAWVSAVAHQHSREHNRELFAKVFRALTPGGRVAIRDIVMESDRTQPAAGALFAVNMLVHTETGGTFTFDEFASDLQSAGFVDPHLAIRRDDMHSVVMAVKPAE